MQMSECGSFACSARIANMKNMPFRLLPTDELRRSWVVANSLMNRARNCSGSNGYERELGFDPTDFLLDRLAGRPTVVWLDLCCGTGRALVQCATRLTTRVPAKRFRIFGLDLVDAFDAVPETAENVEFQVGELPGWETEERFDLVTCVHGLHYVGDKLAALAAVARWLGPDGLFIANFASESLKSPDGKPLGRALNTALQKNGFIRDHRRRRISQTGNGSVSLPFRYLGADDAAGPNYTGQPAVDSYYEKD